MRLPPLNALKAFEAAARHGSFARAAQEMHVSPGAVSRHVKLLEQHFGEPLFRRLAQGLELTEAATTLLPRISAAFADIAKAAAEVAKHDNRLRIIASPTLAGRWLIPRLQEFRKLAPDVTVSLAMMHAGLQEFHDADHDVGIGTFHRDDKNTAGLRIEFVKSEELTPLCAPNLLDEGTPLRSPDDLANYTLISIVACPQDWPAWLAENGSTSITSLRGGPVYDTGELAIRAAVEGLGIVLMDRLLVSAELTSGTLVAPLPDTTPIENGYFFFCDPQRWDNPLIRRFRAWLKAEATK